MNDSRRPFQGRLPENGKLIAVGGAKGGIGKSLFSVNMAVLLSRMGFRTVIADLDLGGSNLHLYMGERRLGSSVNQYLNKEVDSLEEIMVETAYGPLLIGGDSSELGAANIPFARKIKLLRALRALDADFVVIDLGGDISYNILDFFLAADYHIVLCTPEPAAYLDAYRFIKVALYRKLARLFGVESEFQPMRDLELEELLQRATAPQGDIQIKRIDQLLELVRSEQPQHLRLVQEAIASFNPMLVLNRVGPNQNPDPIVGTVTNVSRQMLSVDVEYLGYIPYSSEMEHSAIELVPVVARYPDGEIAATISEIIA